MKSLYIAVIIILTSCTNDENMLNQFLSKTNYTPSEMPSPLWYQAELRFVIDSMKALVNKSYWDGFDRGQNDSFCPPPFVYGYIKLDSGQVIGSFYAQYSDHADRVLKIQHFIIYWDGDLARQRPATPDEIEEYNLQPENGAEIYDPKLYPKTI